MRNLVIFTAFIVCLAGVCAAAVQPRWLPVSGHQAKQKNSAGIDDLPSLRSVSSPSWLDGATEALER
jgi:hypothetical protein